MLTKSIRIKAGKSKGLSEGIKLPAMSDNSLGPGLNDVNNPKMQVQFDAGCPKKK